MQIYTIKNGQNFGPYSQTEIMSRIKSGEYTGNDLAWYEGCTGAVPLSQIMVQPKTEPQQQPKETQSDADLIFIAMQQKFIIWTAVAWVVLGLMPMWPAIAGPLMLAFYATHITGVVSCFLAARALGKNVWLWGILALLPLVNLIAYAKMVSQAAKTLKANGVPTGILGADRKALDRLG